MQHSQSTGSPRFHRRGFFQHTADGILGAALAHLLSAELTSPRSHNSVCAAAFPRPGERRSEDSAVRQPHQRPRATSVIQLFMNGGPSQIDLFDPKPTLNRMDGRPFPGNVEHIGNQNIANIGVMMGGRYRMRRHGHCGTWMADVLPHTAKNVDDICLINSMWTDHPNHDNALYRIHSGRLFMGYPTLGAWTAYGLGSENQNLPAYVVLTDPLGLPKNGARNWSAGFLPPVCQGTPLRPTGAPILNLKPAYTRSPEVTNAAMQLLHQLDRHHRSQRPFQPNLDAHMQAWQMAARMQLTATEALDLSRETAQTHARYGIGQQWTDSYARRCLLARRLVERGVRFVQIFLEEQPWDSHADLESNHRAACLRTDQPVAALLGDLKQRGLLDTTLVIWCGEFGRTPTTQKSANGYSGRDHNMQAFSAWMAGGGIRGGLTYGTTDEFGHSVVENPVSVADFHATILHVLGLHHQSLVYPRNGLQERLTGVEPPRVVEGILA